MSLWILPLLVIVVVVVVPVVAVPGCSCSSINSSASSSSTSSAIVVKHRTLTVHRFACCWNISNYVTSFCQALYSVVMFLLMDRAAQKGWKYRRHYILCVSSTKYCFQNVFPHNTPKFKKKKSISLLPTNQIWVVIYKHTYFPA